MAYAGHQFGDFVPQLGDGRAILLGEVIDRDGVRRDIQLKGSGRTPFSRGGDGRAALGPVLREYIVSEAMAALGIPTTRALAAVTTGEPVVRETVLPGAVLTRVAASHIRVGTFQYFAARGDDEGAARARRLRHRAALSRSGRRSAENPVPARCSTPSSQRQAALIAHWLLVGFIHGVMNTDNMSISGETIDYGPCAFMDAYDPDDRFSSIDQRGRYAYGNQPRIAQWNLARLRRDAAAAARRATRKRPSGRRRRRSTRFSGRFEAAYSRRLAAQARAAEAQADDPALGQGPARAHGGEPGGFHADLPAVCRDAAGNSAADARGARGCSPIRRRFDGWAVELARTAGGEGGDPPTRAPAMRAVNPAFIPRNHRVEEAIAAPRQRRLRAVREARRACSRGRSRISRTRQSTRLPPRPEQVVRQTFCGT